MARVVHSGLREDGTPSSIMLGCAIGDIIPHMGTTAPPGTLVCDGSEVSREAYAELYEEIGSLVGQGDGSTTFNLPDLRGRWMMGADAEHAVGEEIAEGLPDIAGQVGLQDNGLLSLATGAFTGVAKTLPTWINYNQSVGTEIPYKNAIFAASKSNPIYGASAHVTPASVAVLPCIVYE